MIRRPPRSTQSRSSAASDVYKRQDATGIRVGLAFGASAEFIVGEQARAPEWVRRARAEWLWRLTRDPKRLARRYLVEGPGEWWRLQRDSSAEPPRSPNTPKADTPNAGGPKADGP